MLLLLLLLLFFYNFSIIGSKDPEG